MIKRVIITFPADSAGRSLTYELIKKFDIKVSILKADIDAGRRGKLLLELDAESGKIDEAIKYMEQSDVEVSPVERKIRYDHSRCVDCGACTSACLSGALTITAPDWKLNFDAEKCIVCKLCLTACPLKLFTIEFAE
jgi:L-aspartate semialdehyde sulfurtransferase ferredoxin